jgi:hypothetical protein
MATTAADPVFVDTNVLVYSTRQLSAHHAAAAGALWRGLGAPVDAMDQLADLA